MRTYVHHEGHFATNFRHAGNIIVSYKGVPKLGFPTIRAARNWIRSACNYLRSKNADGAYFSDPRLQGSDGAVEDPVHEPATEA